MLVEYARIPLDSRVFLGEGLFETLRVQDGKLCFAQQHWQRMYHAAQKLQLYFPYSFDDWLQRVQDKMPACKDESFGLKVMLIPGHADRGIENAAMETSLHVQAFALAATRARLALCIAPWRRDIHNPCYAYKSFSYLEAIQAKRYAQAQQKDDALFLDMDGRLLETSIANLFFLKGNTVYTPRLHGGALEGIARGRMIQRCAEEGIHCHEVSADVADLKQADAVFLSNALYPIQTVLSLEEARYDVSHPLFQTLIDKF